ncbi:CsbD family protein [Acidipropionibacterium virtanenii]|uniref:CsbD-like domain-containing protein n=1 Tax=Acidipropionibacterium virtanenii TaxID=2057246 RepID=A0A344UW36_9ACTN|nr:CsbD family protein [Acidipropionibacterium virtanenii]AXE39484.1 hypothetical protein JS278_02343 [Acidipropionibacterium virtanenii]
MSDDQSPIDKISGKAKQAAGKVSGDRDLEAEGKVQETEGKLRDAAENAKSTLGAVADRVKGSVNEKKND